MEVKLRSSLIPAILALPISGTVSISYCIHVPWAMRAILDLSRNDSRYCRWETISKLRFKSGRVRKRFMRIEEHITKVRRTEHQLLQCAFNRAWQHKLEEARAT